MKKINVQIKAIFIVIALVFIDQLTKVLVHTYGYGTEYVYISIARNYGALRGLSVPVIVSSILGLLVSVYIVYQLLRFKKTATYYPLVCLLAGILGNTIDRIHFGYVRDMIDLGVRPIFNVADVCIVIGALVLFYLLSVKAN